MKLAAIAVILFSAQAFAATKTEWKSVYTDTKTDCIDVSVGNDRAEIDFATYECKAFAGYRLGITGGDIRYNPTLSFNGTDIYLREPEAFHDMGSTKIEWVYKKTTDDDGSGTAEFKGLIYRLSISNDSGEGSSSLLYAVRLDGVNSCVVGTTTSNTKAREMIYKGQACLPPEQD